MHIKIEQSKPSTTTLEFENHQFSDEEIEYILQCKRLLGLSFKQCILSEHHFEKIAQLPKLVNLNFENTQVSDTSLTHLSQIQSLNYLFIVNSKLTGDGFKSFTNHKKLDCIWVCNTQVNDQTLQYFLNIPKLSTLLLHDTQVSFDGLMTLAQHPKLRVIANMFSAAQIAEFEQNQRDLQKKNKQYFSHTQIEDAKAKLTHFFEAINQWEASAEQIGFCDELQQKCQQIFQQYCTDKPRHGYRPDGLHYSHAPNFSYTDEIMTDIDHASKKKLYIFTRDRLEGQNRYTLLLIEGEWRIDEKHHFSGGWKKYGL